MAVDIERLEAMRREFNEQIDAVIATAKRPVVIEHGVELVGFGEVHKMTSIPVSTLRTFRQRGRMPRPVAELVSGPVWLKSDIMRWTKERKRREAAELRKRAAR